MTIGEISDILVWGAATAYTIAMVAFAIDMARRAGAPAQAAAPQPALATATPVTATSSTTASVTTPGWSARPDSTVGTSAAANAGRGKGTPWGAWRSSKALGIAMSTLWLGFFFNLAGIITRGVAAGRAPWANMYEFTLVGAFCTVLVFLVIQQRLEVRFLGIFVTILSISALMVALNAFHVEAAGVQPALQSYWLVIHVGIAILATGVFGVAFAVSVLQLLQDSRENGSAMLASWHWLDSVPKPVQLEMLSFRINALGFVLWTFTIIGGSVWAEDAWGRYWGWDPKEVWSFVIWVVYAAYLHARTTRGWSGRRAAWFVVVGFACVLFNFTGVNILFNGKHAYSQI
jgi:cytochrome c-type biogenesis protein CcsB